MSAAAGALTLGLCLGAASLSAEEETLKTTAQPTGEKNEAAIPEPPKGAKPNEVVTATADRADGVAAIVNDSVISQYDLRQRTALFTATSGIKPTPEMLKTIRDQVLEQLENERLQLLEAQKKNVTVSSAEVDNAIGNIMQENGLTKDQLEKLLGQAGVHMPSLRSQIAAQIAWSKLVQDEYGSRVDVKPEDVDAEMRRLTANSDKPHFLAAEIFLQVDNPEDEDKIKKKMEDIEQQLHLGAPFQSVARQLSQHPTAAQGGDLGLVVEGQLLPELDAVLTKLHTGEVSNPIRAAGGYYILYVRKRYEGVNAELPKAPTLAATPAGTLPLARVLLPIGPKPPPALRDNALAAANSMREHFNGCAKLPDIVAQLKGAVYMNLGTVRLADMSGQMQAALKPTTAGDSTQPFFSPAGIEIIVRCDIAPPKLEKWPAPKREDIERQLFDEQISVLARRYMRDLRRNADVQTR